MLGKVGGLAIVACVTMGLWAAPVPADAGTFGAVLDGCIAAENYIFVNAEKARALVPEEFLVFGTASPLPVHETALFHYHAVHCETVTVGDTVLTDQFYADLAIGVDPVDDDWMVTATNYYVIALLVSSHEWADYLQLGGLPAQVAQFDRMQIPGGFDPVPDLNVWTITTPEATYTLDFRLFKVAIAGATSNYSNWFGAGPFTRVHNTAHYEATSLEAETFMAEGTGVVADLTGPVRAGDASTYTRWDGPWSWVPGEFA
jgi:hypothetical protein